MQVSPEHPLSLCVSLYSCVQRWTCLRTYMSSQDALLDSFPLA